MAYGATRRPRRQASFKHIRTKPQKETLRPFKGRPNGDTLRDTAPKGPKPGLGQGPAGPKPKAPAVGQHMEPDAAYNTRVDLATRSGEQRLSELSDQEGAIKHDFGIDDPTNPFSRAEGLKKAFLAKQRGRSAALASAGQLYSGAHERALSRTRQEEEEARANLRQAYEGAIGQIGAEKAGVRFTTEEEKAQAFEDWLARAPEADVNVGADAAATTPPSTKIGTLVNPPGAKTVEPSHVTATAGPPGQREALLKIVNAGKKKPAPKGRGGGKRAKVKHIPKRRVRERLR